MKLKVCGLKHPENIAGVLESSPDFIGLIFYEKSPRFIDALDAEFVKSISSAKKVGVFVNASTEYILESSEKYGLDFIQLHGDESLKMVKKLKSKGLDIIKVFRVSENLPEGLEKFVSVAKYFLFDTKTASYGGSGERFDWQILQDVAHPFFLSGGLRLEDVEAIKNLQFEHLVGIDVNSQFERDPGIKDIDKINQLKSLL